MHISQTVLHAHGMHQRTVHVHLNQVGRQRHILVIHLALAVEVSVFCVHEEHQRVLRLEGNRVLQCTFLRLGDGVFHSGNGIVPLHCSAVSLLRCGAIALRCDAVVADAVFTIECPFHGIEFSQSFLLLGEGGFRQRISLSSSLRYHRVGCHIEAQAIRFSHAVASPTLCDGEHSRQHEEKYVDSFLQDLMSIIWFW